MAVIDTGYSAAGAVSGPARVLYAPTSVAIPAKIGDVINLVPTAGVYAPKTGWVDFGLSADASSYSRDFEEEGQEYEQPTAVLFNKVTEITRTMSVNMAQIDQAALKIMEEGTSSTIAASTLNSAQKAVKFGGFSTITSYRVALLQQKEPDAVLVTEGTGGSTRGGLVATVIYRARISADEAEMEVEKGEPTNIDVEFKAYAEPGQVAGVEHGIHLTEDAGVIAIV